MSSVVPIWEENLFLTQRLSGRVLDIGCGQGDYTLRLLDLSNVKSVVAADILALSIKSATFSSWGISHVQCDMESLPFKYGVFDSVFCWRAMQYVRDGERALREFARILVPGGLLMMRMPIDPNGLPKDSEFEDELATGRADAFTWRTFWDAKTLEAKARGARLVPTSENYIDRSASQVRLFRRV